MTKTIRAEANAQLEWTSKDIPANDEVSMEIVWSPPILWTSREIIQFTDNRNFKIDVAVILKSVDVKQRTKNALLSKSSGSRSNNDRIVTKKLTLKSPSPRTKQRLRKAQSSSSGATAAAAVATINAARRMVNTLPPKTFRTEATKKALGIQNQIDELTQIDGLWNISEIRGQNNEKENIKPTTPTSALSMFETFKFTPVMQKRPLNTSNVEFLASLPTPNSNVKVPATNNAYEMVSPSAEFRHRATSPCHNGFNITTTIEMTPQPNAINNQTTTLHEFRTPNVRADQSELFDTTANCTQYASQKTPIAFHQHEETTTTTTILEYNYSFRQTITTPGSPVGGQVVGTGRKLVLDSMYASPAPMRMPCTNDNPASPNANRTHVISSPAHHAQLSVINEEEYTRSDFSETFVKTSNDHQRTYNVGDGNAATPENLARDVKLVGTPLHKKYQSMRELGNENNLSLEQQILKSNQGSMPNLHKLETVKSIENNRYFCQSIEKDLQTQTEAAVIVDDYENDVFVAGAAAMDIEHENLGDISICSIRSTMSTQSVAFKEHEILAQSSQFNLNELGKSSKKLAAHAKPIYFCIDKPSVDRGIASNVSSTPIGQFSVSSPSLNRIGSSQKVLSQSTRDIRTSNTSTSSRPSVITYAKCGATTPGKKRNRDENSNLSKKSFSKQSPPKRACIDRSQSETELAKGGQAFRTKTWGGVMPKKFRVPSVPIQKLTLKRQPDERIILFDPDLHMRGK